MKKMLATRFIPVIFVFIFMLPPLSFSAKERRIALVIGNSAYNFSPLTNPVNDAKGMAIALKKLGFSVTLRTDADQRSMKESIRLFGKKLRSGGVGLFYFAGHGLQVKGRNYLIPVGAKIESESDVEYEAVDAGRVLGKMEDAGNVLNIIMLDACRNNPFGRSFRSAEKGLAKMDAPTGSILAYATAPGSVASDGPGRNGLYTSSLLKRMMTPGLKIEDVFKQVRIDVLKTSENKQVPWESSSLTGDFFFTTERGIAVLKSPSVGKQHIPELEQERENLERERQELERIKLELERKKIEAERERLEAEKIMLTAKERRQTKNKDSCNKVVGFWKWFNGDTQKIKEDGTVDSFTRSFFSGNQIHKNTATWECIDPAHRKFKLVWGGGVWIDTLELSEDGQTLTGFNQTGAKVSGWKK